MITHTYSITVPSFLCAPDDHLGLDGIAGIFQEAAWQHASLLGVAFTEDESEVFWALHRLGLRVHRRPRWGEEITVTTWPSRIKRLFAMREYTVNATGTNESLVEASSAWLVLRATDSRPMPPVRFFPAGDLNDSYNLEMPLGRLPEISHETVNEKLHTARWHPVRPSDTDRNAHVNNTRYAQWLSDDAPELLPSSTQNAGSTTALSFTAETRIGQEYAVITASTEKIAEIRVRDPGDRPETARCACRLQLI